MAKRTTAENLRLQAEKKAAHLELRRRDLRERYPEIAPQAWSNIGTGLGGVGGKAIREWISSLDKLNRLPCCRANKLYVASCSMHKKYK